MFRASVVVLGVTFPLLVRPSVGFIMDNLDLLLHLLVEFGASNVIPFWFWREPGKERVAAEEDEVR